MNTFTFKTSKNVLFALAIASVTMVGVAAHAGEAVAAPTRTVHYADLNLNTDAGVAKLYNRIRNAAQQVCGKADARRLDEAAAADACINHAITASVSTVNNPKLTSEYNARVNGGEKQISLASAR